MSICESCEVREKLRVEQVAELSRLRGEVERLTADRDRWRRSSDRNLFSLLAANAESAKDYATGDNYLARMLGVAATPDERSAGPVAPTRGDGDANDCGACHGLGCD